MTDDLAGRDALQQFVRVRVVARPGNDVLDLILHRDAGGDEIGGRRGLLPGGVGVRGAVLFFVRDGQVELLFVMALGPDNRVVRCRAAVVVVLGHDADGEGLNAVGLEAIHGVNRPRALQMEAGVQGRGPDRFAAALQQRLLVRLDEDEAGGKPQQAGLNQQQPDKGFLQELEEPRLGDLEAELVVQRVRRRGEDALGLAQQTDEATLVKDAGRLAADAGTINFEDEREEVFDRRERENHAQGAGDEDVHLRVAEVNRHDARRGEQAQIRAEQQVTAGGLQQPLAFQPRHVDRVAAGEELQEEEEAEERRHHRQGVAHLARVGIEHLLAEPPGRRHLQHQQHEAERRHQPTLELLAGTPRREGFRVRAVEECCAARGLGQLVEFELLQLLACLHPHLEVAEQRDEEAQPQEDADHFVRVGRRRARDIRA